MKLRKRKVKYPLDNRHEAFCQEYVRNGRDTFEAYLFSDKRILSARASMRLSDLNIQRRLLELIDKKENKSEYEKRISKKYRRYKEEVESLPTKDLEKILNAKWKISNVCDSLLQLYYLLDLYNAFNKELFTRKICEVIEQEKERLGILSSKNPTYWKQESNKVNRKLKTINYRI